MLVRAYYRKYDYNGLYPYKDSASDAVIENVDASRGRWAGTELKFVQTSFEHHKLVYGFEYPKNFVQRQFNYDRDPHYLSNDTKPTSTTHAACGQDEYTFNDQLILNAGLRYDTVGRYKGNINPRVAVIYSPTETTTLKLLYGSAFRAPNACGTQDIAEGQWNPRPLRCRPRRPAAGRSHPSLQADVQVLATCSRHGRLRCEARPSTSC